MKKQSGITLVALIITIIVMTILAGVVIVTAVMDGGILDRAQTALRENERAEVEDIVMTSYVYKTTASINVVGQLDLEETAKAIYSNLTESDYKMKTLAGVEAQRYEDIYTQGASSINLKVEGKQGTYEGTVEKNGLKDGMKIVGDTGNEVPPVDDGNEEDEGVDALEEYYLNLLNKAYESIEVTEEEKNLAQDELIELNDVIGFDIEEKTYWKIKDYCYAASWDDNIYTIVDKNSNEYKTFNSMVNELGNLEVTLKNLIIGYEYTEENWSKEDFKTYIENNLKANVEVRDKELDYLSLNIQSEVNEDFEFSFSTESKRENSVYIIEIVESNHSIGF